MLTHRKSCLLTPSIPLEAEALFLMHIFGLERLLLLSALPIGLLIFASNPRYSQIDWGFSTQKERCLYLTVAVWASWLALRLLGAYWWEGI